MHYRIPIIKIGEVIDWIQQNMVNLLFLNKLFIAITIKKKEDDILGEDLREEY